MVISSGNLISTARERVRAIGALMAENRLVTGSSGNVSVRWEDGCLITATSIPYDRLEAEQIIEIDKDGTVVSGKGEASSEWQMHVAIYKQRKDANAIVHTHSLYATAAAIALSTLPVVHDEGKILFGNEIPVAVHHDPGTSDLAEAVVEALDDGCAALIAYHGSVAVGKTLDTSFATAQKIEETAELYYRSQQLRIASSD